jgi:hypothetical protein
MSLDNQCLTGCVFLNSTLKFPPIIPRFGKMKQEDKES